MTQSNQSLIQEALFQAAKADNIALMREFIAAGADQLELDAEGHNAIFYANLEAPEEIAALLLELQSKEEGS